MEELDAAIVKYLTGVNYNDKHGIRRAIYRGGYPVVTESEVLNAIKRLERRGVIRVHHMDTRGWFKQKIYEIVRSKVRVQS